MWNCEYRGVETQAMQSENKIKTHTHTPFGCDLFIDAGYILNLPSVNKMNFIFLSINEYFTFSPHVIIMYQYYKFLFNVANKHKYYNLCCRRWLIRHPKSTSNEMKHFSELNCQFSWISLMILGTQLTIHLLIYTNDATHRHMTTESVCKEKKIRYYTFHGTQN